MPGHMGVSKLTVTNLEVVEVDEDKNSLLVKGSIPGARGGFLILEKTGKAKGYTPPPEEKAATAEDTEIDTETTETQQESVSSGVATEDNHKKPDQSKEKGVDPEATQ